MLKGFCIHLGRPLQRGKDYPHLKHTQSSILCMELNGTWLWGSSSGHPENMDFYFIAISPGSTLTWSGSTCLGPIRLKIIGIRMDHLQKKKRKKIVRNNKKY